MLILLASLAFSMLVSLQIAKMKDFNTFWQWYFTATLTMLVSIFAFGFIAITFSEIRNYFVGEIRTGTVVRYVEGRDGENNVTFNSSIEFKTSSGILLERTPNFLPASEKKGNTVKLFYNEALDTISVVSTWNVLILVFVIHLTLLLNLPVVGILLYVMGKSMHSVRSLIVKTLFYVILPSSLFFFTVGLYYISVEKILAWNIENTPWLTATLPLAILLSKLLMIYIKTVMKRKGVPRWMESA